MPSTNSRRRRLIAGGAAVAALGLCGTGIAIAQSGGGGGDSGKAPYTSSVTVADSGTDSEANDAALAGLAKISPDQAKAAALAAVPGTAGKVELENEDGNVVYGVEVTTASGSTMDVKVDAGNGKVLSQEADDGAEGTGAPETESPAKAGK
jgi:hypothetical protein